jgi:predicted proteasome-type protease
MTGALAPAAARTADGIDLATVQQELLLYQQHADEVLSVATKQITATHQQLLEERAKHDQTKNKLREAQQLLRKYQPSLAALAGRLKVRQLLSVLADLQGQLSPQGYVMSLCNITYCFPPFVLVTTRCRMK